MVACAVFGAVVIVLGSDRQRFLRRGKAVGHWGAEEHCENKPGGTSMWHRACPLWRRPVQKGRPYETAGTNRLKRFVLRGLTAAELVGEVVVTRRRQCDRDWLIGRVLPIPAVNAWKWCGQRA